MQVPRGWVAGRVHAERRSHHVDRKLPDGRDHGITFIFVTTIILTARGFRAPPAHLRRAALTRIKPIENSQHSDEATSPFGGT